MTPTRPSLRCLSHVFAHADTRLFEAYISLRMATRAFVLAWLLRPGAPAAEGSVAAIEAWLPGPLWVLLCLACATPVTLGLARPAGDAHGMRLRFWGLVLSASMLWAVGGYLVWVLPGDAVGYVMLATALVAALVSGRVREARRMGTTTAQPSVLPAPPLPRTPLSADAA